MATDSVNARGAHRPISVEEKIQLAVERFSPAPLRTFPTPIADLATRYGRAPAVVTRAIASAFRDGLVEVQASDRPPTYQRRLPQLERLLVHQFRQLRVAIVVASNDVDDTTESPRYLQYADEVHAKLGRAMAQVISDGQLVRDGDVIGVGGGRGVYHTVEALNWLPRIRATAVAIESLTGCGHTAHHANKRNLRLESDLHVGSLGPCFADEVGMHFMNHPIVNPSDVVPEPSSNFTGHRRTPTLALLGVGALTHGHQFFDQAFASPGGRLPMFQPIIDSLRELVTLARTFTVGRYCPVGDIAHRFFFVPPPLGHSISSDAMREIMRLVKLINKRIWTSSELQLKTIPAIVLVAGSAIKAGAIRTLLSDPDYHVRFLSTDEQTARSILSAGPPGVGK